MKLSNELDLIQLNLLTAITNSLQFDKRSEVEGIKNGIAFKPRMQDYAVNQSYLPNLKKDIPWADITYRNGIITVIKKVNKKLRKKVNDNVKSESNI